MSRALDARFEGAIDVDRRGSWNASSLTNDARTGPGVGVIGGRLGGDQCPLDVDAAERGDPGSVFGPRCDPLDAAEGSVTTGGFW
jgi:hypothetical protein